MTILIREADLIESVADALQFISYFHPMDYIRALGRAYEAEQAPAAKDAIALDGATQLNQVLGQRVIFSLPGEDRGRVNAVYMTVIFLFGSTGGIAASVVYHAGGWWGTMLLCAAMGGVVLLIFVTEFLGRRRAGD